MQLVNTTRMAAGYTLGTESSGREHLVVVVKGTFDIPPMPDDPALLSAEQVPLAFSRRAGRESSVLT